MSKASSKGKNFSFRILTLISFSQHYFNNKILLALLDTKNIDMCKVKYKGLSDSIFPHYSILLSISLHNWPSYEINCYCLFSDEISVSQCAWTWSTMFFSSRKCTDQTAKWTKVRPMVSSKGRSRVSLRKNKWECFEIWNKMICMYILCGL